MTTQRDGSDDSRYRLLIESITDYAIYMLDPAGHVTSWNPGAERFKGYSAEEVLGAHFSQFYTPEDREAGVPSAPLRPLPRRAGSRPRDGGCGRTGLDSGPTS